MMETHYSWVVALFLRLVDTCLGCLGFLGLTQPVAGSGTMFRVAHQTSPQLVSLSLRTKPVQAPAVACY